MPNLPDDEGPTEIRIGPSRGHVVIAFKEPIKWLGLHALEARQVAEALLRAAAQCESEAVHDEANKQAVLG
jgi:hypothetical protein